MENELNEIYNKLTNQIISIIPVKWSKIYYLGDVGDNGKSWSNAFYFIDALDGETVRSYSIPEKYNISGDEYQKIHSDLIHTLMDLYKVFKKYEQEPWYRISFTLSDDGKFNVDYSYDAMDDTSSAVREFVWAYKTFDFLFEEGNFFRNEVEEYLGISKKPFEDYFSEIQADIVDICLEYVKDCADKIFIYCSYESDVIFTDCFYMIDGQVVQKHKLNQLSQEYDVYIERQRGLIDIMEDDMQKLIKLCDKHERPMPTQIKLIYDVNSKSLNADYGYDLMYSNQPPKMPIDILREWFQSKSGNDFEDYQTPKKTFEECLSEFQTNIVNICLEYAEDCADKIFIYCSYESDYIFTDCFYMVNGQVIQRDRLNEISEKYNVSLERLRSLVLIMDGYLVKLLNACDKYEKPIPTQIKLIYDVCTNSLNTDYKYDLIYSNQTSKTPENISYEWFQNESINQ